jgi:hypothetical protein
VRTLRRKRRRVEELALVSFGYTNLSIVLFFFPVCVFRGKRSGFRGEVVWIAFVLYWQIKAADTKATQRLEPAASRILRVLTFLIAIVLLSIPRIPAALALRPALAVWLLAILAGSRPHRRRPSVRRLGARAPRRQATGAAPSLRHHQAGPRADHHRSLCRGPSSHLYPLHRKSCKAFPSKHWSKWSKAQKPQSEAEDERTKWNQALCGRAARLP